VPTADSTHTSNTSGNKPYKLEIIDCDAVSPTRIHWVWENYLAEGHITTFNGEPGSGKSLITIDIAARITAGRDFPVGHNLLSPSKVLLLTEEEDLAATILPRFLVAEGNPKLLKTLIVNNGDNMFDIGKHWPLLIRELQGQDYKLIIIDPLIDYTCAKPNQDEEVRPVLRKLFKICQELGVACAGISHLNKKEEQKAIHRASGARAWTAVPRFNFLVGKGDGEMRHICPLKNNLIEDSKKSLDFRTKDTVYQVEDGGQMFDTHHPRIAWAGLGVATAQGLLESQSKQSEQFGEGYQDCIRLILKDGEWHPKADVIKEIQAESAVSERTIERVAYRMPDLERTRTGTPARCYWRLRSVPTVPK